MSNEQSTPESREYRTGYGQTAYKRSLAYQHLGIHPAKVPCKPFFRASLKRIARLMNRPRPKGEVDRGRHFGPFDCLQASADPDACKVSRVYRSVPESYRRLLPAEVFCYAAGVSEARVLELIAGAVAWYHVEASAIVAAVWHPAVVRKTVERALQDGGTKERQLLFSAMGPLRP